MDVLLVVFPAGAGRLRTLESAVLSRVNIPRGAMHIHRFVVSGQRVNIAFGPLLQFHQQIHHLAAIGPAVGDVPGLDEVGSASCPVLVVVDEAGRTQQLDKLLVVTMDISKSNDAVNPCPGIFRRRRGDTRSSKTARSEANPGE